MSGAIIAIKTTRAATVRIAVSTNSGLTSPTYFGPEDTEQNMAKITVSGLSANTLYYYGAEIDGVLNTGTVGKFTTPASAPGTALSFKFAFSSCAQNGSNHVVFDRVRAQSPMFFAHLGDIHYQDIDNDNISMFRAMYTATFAAAKQHQLYREVPIVYMFDDHDFGDDDADGTSNSREAAIEAYRERVPHYPLVDSSITAPIYHSFEIGRFLFIVTDLRSESSPHANTDNSSKTKMGTTQKTWFKNLLSDPGNASKFIIWLSTSPWVPNTVSAGDHWGGYNTERVELANHIKTTCLGRIVILTGDTHAIAMDTGTNGDYATGGGCPIREFTASPLDQTTGVWGATYSSGYFQNVGQFGIVDITDSGGSTCSITWTGMKHDGTTIVTDTFSLSL